MLMWFWSDAHCGNSSKFELHIGFVVVVQLGKALHYNFPT